MKKTLTTLLVAAACATGAYGGVSLNNPEFVLEGSTLTSTQVFEDYMLTLAMRMDADKLEAAMTNSGLTDISSVTMNGTAYTLRFNSNKVVAYQTADSSKYWTIHTINTSSVVWENVQSAALTFIFDSSSASGGLTSVLTLGLDDGQFLDFNAKNTGFKSTGGDITALSIPSNELVKAAYVMSGTATVDEAKKLNRDLIPEPTSTTLSLLALAALAVRRRRR